MTLDDARKIAAIAGTIDGGCPDCVEDFIRRLNYEFPDFAWQINLKSDEYGASPDKRVTVIPAMDLAFREDEIPWNALP